MKYITHMAIVILIALFAMVAAGSAKDYYAVCSVDGCQLQAYGASCYATNNAVLQKYIDGSPAPFEITPFWIWPAIACTGEGIYDYVRNLNMQEFSNCGGYSDRQGQHSYYCRNGCKIEIIQKPGDPVPAKIKIDSDQCRAP